MKRFILLAHLFCFSMLVGFAQSGAIIDDIYVSPNDASMVNAAKQARRQRASENAQSVVYRNGAKEIVFIDQNGKRTTAISDTVYVITDSIDAEEQYEEEGYYLNGFNGSQSDLEYAERIRRFHNPRFTITIADPGYNDIYFLDNSYWNVYVDGMYATITPTWTNPYWWNYQYSSFGYNSWAWRYNWGNPWHYGMGGYYGWNSPFYGGYYGMYDPWYSGYYGWGGYYGWDYPYYGGYYGWGYPYYGDGYGSATSNQVSRRNVAGGRTVFDSGNTSRRTSVINSGSGATRSANTTVSRQVPTASDSRDARNASTINRGTRVVNSQDVNTRMRTGSVRSSDEWSNVRSNNTRTYSGNNGSTIINRTSPSNRSTGSEAVRSSGGTTRSSSSSTPSRSYESSGRSSDYSTPSRSYDSGSSRSSVSSGGGSYGGSSSSSGSSGGGSRSSGGGGRR